MLSDEEGISPGVSNYGKKRIRPVDNNNDDMGLLNIDKQKSITPN